MSVIKQELQKRKRFTVVGCKRLDDGGVEQVIDHILAVNAGSAFDIAIGVDGRGPEYVAIAVFSGYQNAL